MIVSLCLFRFLSDVPAAIVVRPPAFISVIATQSVKLACVAYGSPTPQSIVWTDEFGADLQTLATDTDFNSGATVKISQETLSILEICHIDSAFTGNYSCTADNGVSGIGIAPASAMFLLTVTEPFTSEGQFFLNTPLNT